MPGGCAIGARPINMHVTALEQLGATIEQSHGYVEAARPDGLARREISFRSHYRDGNGRRADGRGSGEGETVIRNAAREPEVKDLAALLNKMGAKIEGAGNIHHPREGRREAARCRARPLSRTALKPERFCWLRAIPGRCGGNRLPPRTLGRARS